MFKNDKKIIIVKKTKNFNAWLLLWNKISPPSVEYMDNTLMQPSKKIQINKIKSKFFNCWKKFDCVLNELCCIYILIFFWILACSLSSCLSIINLKSFFAIGAAAELPDPPCSITILNAYLGFLYGPKAIYNAWSLSL